MKNDEIIVSCHLVLIPLNTHIIVPVFPGDDINNYLKKSYTELYAVVFRKNNYNKDLAYLLSLLTFKEACILSTHPLATGFCEGRKYYNKFATSNLTSLELEKVAISNELADIKIKLTDLVGESLVMSVISDMIYCGVDLVFSLTFEQAFGTAVNGTLCNYLPSCFRCFLPKKVTKVCVKVGTVDTVLLVTTKTNAPKDKNLTDQRGRHRDISSSTCAGSMHGFKFGLIFHCLLR